VLDVERLSAQITSLVLDGIATPPAPSLPTRRSARTP
jgi:hypothetical protein